MTASTYNLVGYGSMVADRIRMGEYAKALRRVVRPGDVVMDIGTGPGIMAVLACQLGAKRVYAIETSEVIQVARAIAAANHCTDRIEFFEDLSTKVTVPEPANVIVSDLRGVLPLYEFHIPAVVDARRRFLAPGGTLIGREDRMWVAVVEAPERYEKLVGPWEHNVLDQDLTPARRMVVNDLHKISGENLRRLTDPNLWAVLNYMQIEDPGVQGELTWTVQRNGTGHGVVIWFDADLADGAGFSNSPDSPELVYSSMFLPWQEPVPLVAGQKVCVNLQAKLLDSDYFWRWSTRVESPGKSGEIAVQLNQSQLSGMVMSIAKLHKRDSNFVPKLSGKGLAFQRALELMDGSASLEAIAKRLAAEFPGRFESWQQALSFAGEISIENSR